MSTGLTPNYSLQYPISTDPVNVARDIEDLAIGLDTFLNNPSFINNVDIDGGSLTTTALTANVFNTNATTANIVGAATNIIIGATTGTTTIRNANTVVAGDLAVNGGDLTTNQTNFNLFNATATTLNIGGSATALNLGASAGQVNIAGDLNLATGKVFEINNVSVLSETTLGSSVVTSSLTAVGTITTGIWSATTIAVNKGGTGLTSYTIGDIVYASGTNTLAKLAGAATGNALISGGVGAAPSWGKIGLTTHVSGTLPVANGGTGITSLGSGISTWLKTPSSANLAAAITDETGSGSLVFATNPALSGTPTAPTAAVGTNTTQIATTAFVNAEISNDAILKTIVDDKGDLIVATANNTISRLAVGENGYVLVADSAEPTGVKWAIAQAGATGGGTDQVFYNNDQNVTTSYSIPSLKNSMSAGPITINSGATVTVPSGSVWTVV